MQFDVEIVLRETNQAVTARLEHGTDPASWREPDVEIVLKQILLAIDRTKKSAEAFVRACRSLRYGDRANPA